jgi:NADH-quinone oxidoreductase subunit L
MSDVPSYLWLIPALPLAAFAVTGLFGPRLLRQYSHWPCILAVIGSFILSVMVAAAIYREAPAPAEAGQPPPPQIVAEYYRWIVVGSPFGDSPVDIGFRLRADALSAMMLVMITFIGTWIAIYSVGYMHGDEGYARFFAEIALFIFMMTLLVLADNFVLLYAGWEGVGLCSYLLIGFWFTRPSAANAARKAFLVTRVGDVGLLLGILLLWWAFNHSLTYDSVLYGSLLRPENVETLPPETRWLITGACLLIFCGAVGKSAQFPLHVWLPDAMEGPTPVSALIHAATMVTAGVYLVARCTPLFAAAPEAQAVVACIGGFTALFAALIALTQNDLKRVLAYSTISQLGYMFLALGCAVYGTQSLVSFAVIAAMFHLFTHAFFKALLFLAAGSVMHAMGNVIDMRRFGGLKEVMPWTRGTFLCGALALAGFPLLSGWWSKDDVLAATWAAGQSSPLGGLYLALWVVGLATAGLTAFYTFRAYYLTFYGPLRVPPEADLPHHGHAHDPAEAGAHQHGPTAVGHAAHPQTVAGPRASYESPRVMTVPLVVLAVFAVGVGFVLGPLMPGPFQFSHFLALAPGLPHGEEAHNWGFMVLSGVIALCGIGLARWMYILRPDMPAKVAASLHGLYQLSLSKFHVDELYGTFILKPLRGVTVFCRIFDQYVIDGLVDLLGHVPRLIGARFRPVQNGLVQFYALAMVLGLTVFLLVLVSRL